MGQAKQWFDVALAIADPVERSQAMSDLAFDAEQMARDGCRAEAIELFELLATLDRYDDLLLPAIESADQRLISLRGRSLPSLDEVVKELYRKFADLPERERLLAVAKTLVRDHGRRRPESWGVAAELVAAAEAIRPLAGKELRFRLRCRNSYSDRPNLPPHPARDRVALLRFTNPTDIPAYGDWDFQVFGAGIALRAEDMREVYAAYLENHRRYHINISTRSGRYAEAQRVTELHAMLSEACQAGRDVTLDGHDYVWSFSSDLMFEKQFESVQCPVCQREFGPEECRVLEWSFGEDLAASGGRRVVCPSDHTLYSCMEWNS